MILSFARLFRALPLALTLALAVPAVVWADDGDDAAEFDMSTAAAAFTLLSGGVLMLTARRKRREAP